MKSFCAAVLIGGLAVAGCSSSSKSSSSSPSSSSASSASSSSGSTGDQASQLDALVSGVQETIHATFKAVYTTSGAGQSSTVTIEQKPPKTLFSSGGAIVINDGTTTHFCSDAGGQKTCLTQSGANPLASLQQLFSPTAAVTALQAYKAEAATHAAGVSVTFSSASYGGQDSTCVSATASGQTGKYCIAKGSGLLTFESAGGESFQLTEYSTNVPDSDFSVSGASSITVPGGY